MRKKNLIHLSDFNEEDIKEFEPRIPVFRIDKEDKTTPRICTSTTMEGCFLGHPLIMYHFYYYLESEYGSPYEHMGRLHTLLEKNKHGMLLKAYHFEVEEDSVYTADYLYENGYVGDANETKEHWITKKIKPNKMSYILLEKIEKNSETQEFEFEYSEYETLEEVGTYVSMFDMHFLLRQGTSLIAKEQREFSVEEATGLLKEIQEQKNN